MHFSVPPQSPVWHLLPVPVLSKLQPVLPHIRPFHPGGAEKTADWPGFRAKPPLVVVVLSGGDMLLLGAIPGQIVSLQLLIMVRLVDSTNQIPVHLQTTTFIH